MRVLRVFHHYVSGRKVALFAAELAAIGILFSAAAVFGTWGAAHVLARGGLLVASAVGCALVFQTALYFSDLYDLRVALGDRAAGTRLLRAMAAAVVACAALALAAPAAFKGGVLLAGVAGAAGALVLTRLAMPTIVGRPERVLIVGNGTRGRELALAIEESAELEVVGAVAAGVPGQGLEDLDALAHRLGADLIAVALDDEGSELPADALLRCRLDGLQVIDALRLAERALRRVPLALTRAEDFAYGRRLGGGRIDELVKRGLDLAASFALTVVSLPIMLGAALAIRLDSPGPIFYRQERVGHGGRRFTLVKFRTMRVDAERDGRPVWAQVKDDRVTRVGRVLRLTRMDELPQVLAVLAGHMSFVGPRPERPFFVEQIKQKVPMFGLREAVKPGITGWAQIRYPYGASIEDARAKLEYDLYYIRNRSVFLDLSIIFHTVRHVLCGRGAR